MIKTIKNEYLELVILNLLKAQYQNKKAKNRTYKNGLTLMIKENYKILVDNEILKPFERLTQNKLSNNIEILDKFKNWVKGE